MTRKAYLAKIEIVSPSQLSNDLENKIKKGIFSAELSREKFERIVEEPNESNPNGVSDIYRTTPGSVGRSTDEVYLSGYLLKESTLKAGKIDEETGVKDERRTDNDEGVRFNINLREMVVTHYAVNRFRNDQFNNALTFILNKGLERIGILDVKVRVESIKDNKAIGEIKEELQRIENIKSLTLEYSLGENAKDYPEVNKLTGHSFNTTIKTGYAQGIAISDTYINQKIDEILEAHSVIEGIREEHGVVIGTAKISGQTITGKTFCTNNSENITYEIDDYNCKLPFFIDASKDIIEDYIRTYIISER